MRSTRPCTINSNSVRSVISRWWPAWFVSPTSWRSIPIQGIWQLGRVPPLGGGSPAMYWYGFVFTAALGALAMTAIASFIPDKLMDRVPWRSLTWLVPICAIIYIGYVLSPVRYEDLKAGSCEMEPYWRSQTLRCHSRESGNPVDGRIAGGYWIARFRGR